jgi:hypothetical protein
MARGGEKTRVRYSAKTGVYIYLKQNDLFGGGGGSRSVTIVEFSNDFENSIGSIGEKRQKALVQVQNRYSGPAAVRKTADGPCNRVAHSRIKSDRRIGFTERLGLIRFGGRVG